MQQKDKPELFFLVGRKKKSTALFFVMMMFYLPNLLLIVRVFAGAKHNHFNFQLFNLALHGVAAQWDDCSFKISST